MPLGDTDTFTADVMSQPDQSDPSMSEAYSGPDSTPKSKDIGLAQPTPSPRQQGFDQPTLDRAYHTIDFLQRNPQWLANPYTQHAANALLAGSSRMIEMSIQLERVSSQADAVKLKLNTDTRLINHLNDGLAKLKDMTVVAAIRDEVQANGPTPKAISMLNQQLESEKPLLEPEPMSMTLNDGTEVVGWVDPKTRKFTQYRPPQERSGGATQYPEPIIKEIGGRPFLFYRNFAPKPLDRLNAQQQVQANVNAAALKAARLAITKAFDEDSRAAAQKEYDRQLGIFNDYFEVINADKGKVGPAPTNAPASPTNAPQKIGRFLVTPQ